MTATDAYPASGQPRRDPSGDQPGGPRADARKTRRFSPERIALYAIGGLFGGLVLAVVLILWLFNWNMLRGPLARYASEQTGRSVRLDGDLKVHLLTWSPTVSIGGLKIGNPKWQGPGQMATADRVVVSVRLLPLLHGQVVLPLLQIDKPNADLLVDAQGRQNFDLSKPGAPKSHAKLPPIQRFIINDGRLKYVDVKKKMSLDAEVDSNESATGPSAHAFRLSGKGALNNRPFNLLASGGPLVNVRPDRPYPFTGDIRAADTHITASGFIPKPFDLGAYQTDLHITGKDLADLYYLTNLTLPNSPAYDVRGHLTHEGQEYDFDRAAGRLGSSDIEGFLHTSLTSGRPNVKATLSSRVLDFKDLSSLFGVAPAGKAGTTASAGQKAASATLAATQRLLPDAPLYADRLRAMDATLHYHAASIRTVLPLKKATLDLTLDHGLLTIHPLTFDFPQGHFTTTVALNGRAKVPVTDVDARLSNVAMQNFVPHPKGQSSPLDGTLAARVKLHGVGDSVHRAAAASNGAVTAVIPRGHIRQAFAELLGTNAGKGLHLLLAKDNQETNLRCAIASFDVRNGQLTARQVVFDTDVVRVNGTGGASLGDETIDLTLRGDTKKFRLTHVFLPITVKGHLRSPAIGVQPAPAIAQAGAAVALGVFLTPLAAVLPFVDPGLAKDADCAGLLSDAGAQAAPVKLKASSTTLTPSRRK